MTYDEALDMFESMCDDVRADFGEDGLTDGFSDLVAAACWQIPDDDVARELCRTQLGYVPHDMRARLGDVDWLE